jgi:hypothetical protein
MYATGNPKTKKLLKQRVTTHKLYPNEFPAVRIFSPGPFPAPENGWVACEGPQYPEPHRWCARVKVENGVIVQVK